MAAWLAHVHSGTRMAGKVVDARGVAARRMARRCLCERARARNWGTLQGGAADLIPRTLSSLMGEMEEEKPPHTVCEEQKWENEAPKGAFMLSNGV